MSIALAPSAAASTEFLPWAAPVSCSSSYGASTTSWLRYKFVTDTDGIISSGTALVSRLPTGDKESVIDILATDGTADSIGATLLGTLVQSSYVPTSIPVFGTGYTVTYSGSISLAAGTYWVSIRGTGLPNFPNPTQGLCLTSSISTQSPWYFDLTAPYAYATNNGGATYTSQGGIPDAPFISLSGTARGGGGTSIVAAPAPTLEMNLNSADGTSCTTSASGTQGTWVTLPAASDCTAPVARTGAVLLGWATAPNFPIAIAQRQVNNGWGTYEIFNEEGQITAVFIPAGGATFLSAAGSLYPIWNT